MSKESVKESATQVVAELAATIKPKLRGWLHLGMFPIALIGGVVLSIVSRPGSIRTACIVFTVTASLLFGVSALYHRGHWGPKMIAVLKRLDHSNIYLIIAGTYTPFAVALLPWDQAKTLLMITWFGALAGVLFRTFWVGAPRWLYVALYIVMGWIAVFYVVPFWSGGGPVIGSLIALGGVLYTAGAVIYGTRKPDPSPRWFGYHEVFHALTLLAFAAHFTAVALAVTNSGTTVALG